MPDPREESCADVTAGWSGPQDRAEAFIRLLEPHRGALYSFAKSLIWNKEGVEDAIQDAVMAAYRGFDAFQPGTNFRAWMFKYLMNTIFNLNKKTRRRPEVQLAEDVAQVLVSPESASLPGLQPDPINYLEHVSDPIRRAVLRLPQSQRVAFLLRAINDFTYGEIADMMKAPIGTVMSLLSRARTRLREELADLGMQTGQAHG